MTRSSDLLLQRTRVELLSQTSWSALSNFTTWTESIWTGSGSCSCCVLTSRYPVDNGQDYKTDRTNDPTDGPVSEVLAHSFFVRD